MREKVIEQYLAKNVRCMGGVCWKWVSPSLIGVPDRIVIVKGAIWFVELKAPKGELSAAQRQVGAIIKRLVPTYIVISNKREVDDFIDLLHLNRQQDEVNRQKLNEYDELKLQLRKAQHEASARNADLKTALSQKTIWEQKYKSLEKLWTTKQNPTQ